MQAYRFNEKARYSAGWQGTLNKSNEYAPPTNSIVYTEDEGKWLRNALAKSPSIYVSSSDSFISSAYRDIFQGYIIHMDSDEDAKRWTNDIYNEDNSSMNFYQNQLNFAIWCASTGCGISTRDHLMGGDGLTQSLFRFSVYYQASKILKQLKVPLPNDKAFHANNNGNIDVDEYAAICREFGVSKDTDWRFKMGHSQGMGTLFVYVPTWNENNHYMPTEGDFNLKVHTFGQPVVTKSGPDIWATNHFTQDRGHVEYVQQENKFENGWMYFIVDKSDGFTEAGVNRLNDSIRTYVWAILTAQSLTKTSIVRTLQNPATEPQRTFLSNLEVSIASTKSLQDSINGYQDALKYASSKVDYVVGFGLYMMPSNMVLRITTIDDYNNNLMVASPDTIKNLKLGTNEDINKKEVKKTDVNIPDKLSPSTIKTKDTTTDKTKDTNELAQSNNTKSDTKLTQDETNLLIYLAFAVVVSVGGFYLYRRSKERR